MVKIDVGNGIALDTQVYGDAGAEPLLLICSTSQSWKLWDDLARALAAGGYHVVCYDHRGIGDSTRGSAKISTAGLATDATALLDALGINQTHVLGWSLGSAVAQELAIAHPGRVGALVLYGTWAHVDRFQAAVLTALRHPWTTGDTADALTALAIAFSPELINSPDFEALVAAAFPTFPQTATQVAATLEQWDADLLHDTRDRLGTITNSTLVVAGEQDLLAPVWQGKAVADAIPGAKIEVFTGPGSSHALAWERPAEFHPLVLGFLGAHSLA